ncbi:Hypothetical predicted protein [Pelobates cultripes]|uniref:Uncharacterized protein n=1 Tax=Pelobates cultripes TaxID=61616 RepID=A0AAD1WI72_PELCU|nr:Hypothetical predicted protein [Pelobates cultripes]
MLIGYIEPPTLHEPIYNGVSEFDFSHEQKDYLSSMAADFSFSVYQETTSNVAPIEHLPSNISASFSNLEAVYVVQPNQQPNDQTQTTQLKPDSSSLEAELPAKKDTCIYKPHFCKEQIVNLKYEGKSYSTEVTTHTPFCIGPVQRDADITELFSSKRSDSSSCDLDHNSQLYKLTGRNRDTQLENTCPQEVHQSDVFEDPMKWLPSKGENAKPEELCLSLEYDEISLTDVLLGNAITNRPRLLPARVKMDASITPIECNTPPVGELNTSAMFNRSVDGSIQDPQTKTKYDSFNKDYSRETNLLRSVKNSSPKIYRNVYLHPKKYFLKQYLFSQSLDKC